jgi:hypothetical protein
MAKPRQTFKTVGRAALDSKNRLSLTRAVKEMVHLLKPGDLEGLTFKIQLNEEGQVLLSPEVSVPLKEAWLFHNAPALDAVRRGLREAELGQVVTRGSFRSHAEDDIE